MSRRNESAACSPEEAKNETQKIQQRHPARRGHAAQPKVLRGPDHAGPIRHEERAQSPKGEEHAWLTIPGDLPSYHRHSTERHAFQGRVDRRRETGPQPFEDRDQGDDEPCHD